MSSITIHLHRVTQPISKHLMLLGTFLSNDCLGDSTGRALVTGISSFS